MRASRPAALAFLAYIALAVAYTWPVLVHPTQRVPSDPFDPILNASILWWNATVIPFSSAWWSPPHFFPAENVAAFTENLVGLSVISSPIIWLTGQPVLAYNLMFFVAGPLSAFTTYLLARSMTGRQDASFIAGLVFGFAPYRLTQLGHLQVLSAFWLPLAVLALHLYIKDRRRGWLVLFGSTWLLQSLSNGYYMFFGGVLIAMWLLYFGSTRATWRPALDVVVAWIVASLPLAAVMWKYRSIHHTYGLTRGVESAISLSAQPQHWLRVSDINWLWSRFLDDGGAEFNLFPGIAAVMLVVAGVIAGLLAFRKQTLQQLRTRSAFVFYVAALLVIAVLACGPEIHSGRDILMSSGPYRWLMAVLPGLDGLRVVARFWMIGALCLAIASGLAFAWLVPRSGTTRAVVFSMICAGVLVDGWPNHMPMAAAPILLPALESRDVTYTVLELPLGPKWDAAATFRAVANGRRVVNGVSGYEPLHYPALQNGLDARDPTVIVALASLGTLDVVLDRSNDPDGSLARMVEGIGGVVKVAENPPRVLYRVPKLPPPPDGAGALVLYLLKPAPRPPR